MYNLEYILFQSLAFFATDILILYNYFILCIYVILLCHGNRMRMQTIIKENTYLITALQNYRKGQNDK